MTSWSDEAKSVVAELERRLARTAPTPTYQKVVVWALALGALAAFLGFLIFR